MCLPGTGVNIRTSTRALQQLPTTAANLVGNKSRRSQRQLSKRTQKRLVRYSLVLANFAVLAAVVGLVVRSPKPASTTTNSIISAPNTELASNALDQVSSADIAVHVARLTNLPETNSVVNKADTVNAQLAVSAASESVVAKPQVVNTSLKSWKDIKSYVVVAGDTIPSIGAKFGITSDSVRWSNGLTGDNVDAGKKLLIPPVNGIAYTVKAGDTPDSLAVKFSANKDSIIADNDVIGALRVGSVVLIRDGTLMPAPLARRSYSAGYGSGFAWGGSSAIYNGGANGYDYGYCTWWAAYRRAQVGRPVPSNLGNASSWKLLGQRAGFGVGNVPRQYAVIWTPPRDYYGHVGFVESVNADGSANISEMNVAGWGVVSRKTLSASEAAAYSYIY